jgi:hypothetical protein
MKTQATEVIQKVAIQIIDLIQLIIILTVIFFAGLLMTANLFKDMIVETIVNTFKKRSP